MEQCLLSIVWHLTCFCLPVTGVIQGVGFVFEINNTLLRLYEGRYLSIMDMYLHIIYYLNIVLIGIGQLYREKPSWYDNSCMSYSLIRPIGKISAILVYHACRGECIGALISDWTSFIAVILCDFAWNQIARVYRVFKCAIRGKPQPFTL